MARLFLAAFLSVLCAVSTGPAYALTADDLEEIVGYTAIANSNVVGDFEGSEVGETVALDNGMVFEFNEYSYTYSYRPTTIVFAWTITPAEMRRAGMKDVPNTSMTLYKLVIDDDIYDVTRVR